jgi:hypothetical protein
MMGRDDENKTEPRPHQPQDKTRHPTETARRPKTSTLSPFAGPKRTGNNNSTERSHKLQLRAENTFIFEFTL